MKRLSATITLAAAAVVMAVSFAPDTAKAGHGSHIY